MSTEPHVPTLAELARRAAEIVDPARSEPAVTALVERFEDRDEPVTTIGDVGQELDEALEALDPGPNEPAATVAAAVVTYLAYRRDHVDDDPESVLRLATRAEFDDQPDPAVANWLAERGVAV